MVNIALSLTVAFVPFISQEAIAASTTAAEATGDTRFSFSDWTDSIITNPETTLSPEEAVQAFLDSMSALATRSSGLENNYTVECLTDYTNDVSAQAIDAAHIIRKFASLGPNMFCFSPGFPFTMPIYCPFRTAMLMPHADDHPYEADNPADRETCQYIAKIAALVMDRCTQPNGTVTGLTHYDLPGTKPGVMLVKNPGDFAWP